MSMIRIFEKSSKKKKPNAKQRQLQSDWEAMLKKYESKKEVKIEKKKPLKYNLGVPEDWSTKHLPSVETTRGNATKGNDKVYTGDKILGIAVMHKSSMVPIFSQEEAVDVARMRHG